MSGWYELSKSSNDQFKFTLKAGNGEAILSSEQYTTRAAAENGIESVQKNSGFPGRNPTGKPLHCFSGCSVVLQDALIL